MTPLIPEPNCPDAGDYNLRWNFAVSAPGYSIASAEPPVFALG